MARESRGREGWWPNRSRERDSVKHTRSLAHARRVHEQGKTHRADRRQQLGEEVEKGGWEDGVRT